MVQMTPVQCRAHDYVHTSGVAFVRISTWEDDNDPFMNDQHGSIMDQHSGRYWGFYRVFSHDVTAAILVSQNNETAAMLVSQTNPVGVKLFSYANAFFCCNKFA